MKTEERIVKPDTLSWLQVKFSTIKWTNDSKGFFYSHFPPPKDAGTEPPNINQKLFYHFVGTDQSEDILCWKDADNPEYMFEAVVTDDRKYVLIYMTKGADVVNKVYYLDLNRLSNGLEGFKGVEDVLPFMKLVDNFDAFYSVVANDDAVFTFRTNKDASRYKLVRVDLNTPTIWTDVIPESEKDVLESATAVNQNQLLVCYLSDVKHVLQVRDLETGSLLHHLPLGIGAVDEIFAERNDNVVFFRFTSFLSPGLIFECDLEADVPEMKIFRGTVVHNFDRSEFQVAQVFVSSKDGTKLPMVIVAKKGTPMQNKREREESVVLKACGLRITSIKIVLPYTQIMRLLLMAPTARHKKVGLTRMDAAIDALKPMGYSPEFVHRKVRDLLNVYGDEGWAFIEEAAYSLLIEYILEDGNDGQCEQGEPSAKKKMITKTVMTTKTKKMMKRKTRMKMMMTTTMKRRDPRLRRRHQLGLRCLHKSSAKKVSSLGMVEDGDRQHLPPLPFMV